MTADKDGLQECARPDFLDRINMMNMIMSHTEDAENAELFERTYGMSPITMGRRDVHTDFF